MKCFNVIVDAIVLYLFLYFVTPILLKNYEILGTALPIVTKIFLSICDFWRFYYYSPIIIYLSLIFIMVNYTSFFRNDKYCILYRIPFLASLTGGMVFMSLPILSTLN